jgi:hypothetical protein
MRALSLTIPQILKTPKLVAIVPGPAKRQAVLTTVSGTGSRAVRRLRYCAATQMPTVLRIRTSWLCFSPKLSARAVGLVLRTAPVVKLNHCRMVSPRAFFGGFA